MIYVFYFDGMGQSSSVPLLLMKLGSKYDLLDTPGKLNENKVKMTKI